MYKIILPNFEGPFDLLLYFIRRDELNIYDIPIAKITEEFLKYIRLIRYFDLELAGEFLVMAATLMYIKAQMLLPRDENPDGGESEDPRTQLVRRLIEYRQFKDASKNIAEIAEDQKYVYYRRLFDIDEQTAAKSANIGEYKNSSLFDLLKAFQKALDRANAKPVSHVVNMIPVSVEEKRDLILEHLGRKKRISFFDIAGNQTRIHIVVTFLAVLELIKLKKIFILQSEAFDDIIIAPRPDMNMN